MEVEALRLTVQGLIISDMAVVLFVLVVVLGSFSGLEPVELVVAVVFLSSSECRVNQAFFSLW